MPKKLVLASTWILCEICHFWVQNVKLGKIWPCYFNGLGKIYLEPKFHIPNLKNKKSGQQSGYQKIWKILLWFVISFVLFFRRKRRKRGDNDFTVLFRKPINQIDIYARVGGVCNPNTSSILNKLQLCKYTLMHNKWQFIG